MVQLTERKTILYVSNDTGVGGATVSLIDMLEFMKQFITPIVISPGNMRLEERMRDKGITYYVVNTNRGFGKIGEHTTENEEKDFLINYNAALRIKEIIKDNNVSLVHINSSVSNAGAIAAILSGTPYVWHLREVLEQHYGCEFWDKRLKQILFDAADGYIAISECVKQDYEKKYNINPIKLYNIIDSRRFKEELSNRTGSNIILAGNVSEAKRQLDAIEAVKFLCDNGHTNIKLYIVGGFNGRSKWCCDRYIKKYKLEKNIILMPFVDDLSEIRKQCVISLTTSRYEGLGRVTVEAMLAGNIVIGADTGETPYLVGIDGERGYLYRMGDASSLADTILKVLTEEDGHNELLIRAQNFAETTFAGVPYAQNLNEYYERILSNKHKGLNKENAIKFIEQKYEELRNKQDELDDSVIVNKVKRIAELNNMWKAGVIADCLREQNITNVAIYGMGELGCRLYDELMENGIDVVAVIDRNPYFLEEIIKVYDVDEDLPNVKNIISTVVSDFNKVKSVYKGKNVLNLVELIENSSI